MKFRELGATGLNCSIIGLGTGRLGSFPSRLSNTDVTRLLNAAEECGVNLIDTADSYGQGESERLLGRALRGRRSRFLLATKAGYEFPELAGLLRFANPFLKKLRGQRQNFQSDHVRIAIERSLNRLRTDVIDLFYLHSPPLDVMRMESLWELLRQLKAEGKIRHLGVSSFSVEVLGAAAKIDGVSVVQAPVNSTSGDMRLSLAHIDTARIGVVANHIFAGGKMLADGAPSHLQQICAEKNISPRRLLIQLALAQPAVSCALSGTTKPEHLRQNVADALAPMDLDGVTFADLS